jgi:hypothetical protein
MAALSSPARESPPLPRGPNEEPSRDDRTLDYLLALLVFAALVGVYFVVRPGGRWAESDTAAMASAIRAILATGRLTPDSADVYGNGYGYQAVSVALLAFTGISVDTLQQVVYPVLSALVVLPAWALYRELTGSGRVATLATLLLLLVPEYLFAVLRGSHERIDRIFLMTTLWLLVRSLRFREQRATFAAHLGLVLLMVYGLIATNGLFGLSFVVAIATTLGVAVVGTRGPAGVRAHAAAATRLLQWTSVAAVLLIILFVAVYPPFGNSLRELIKIPGSLIDLIINGGSGVNSYSGVLAAWISPAAYLVLSAADYVILLVSGLVWLWLGWSWLSGRRPSSIGIWMLWTLYAAFVLQGAMSVASDRTGALQGNVLYRAFAVFATIAAPLVAVALSGWRPRSWLRSIAVVAVAIAATTSVLKSSLDPTVSNKWMQYTAAEIQGLRWADGHQRSTKTWIGPDDRLPAAYELAIGNESARNAWDIGDPKPETQSFVVTNLLRLNSLRLGKPLPPLGTLNLLYDNGDAQVYRSRPLAAFDR